MNEAAFIAVVLVATISAFGAVALALAGAANARKEFVRAFDGDDEVSAENDGHSGRLRLRTVRALPRAELVLWVPPGKIHTWTVRVAAPAFARRTTLKLSREGVSGFVREHVLGWHDIKVGDATFDAALNVRGSDPAVVRALFASRTVRDAAVALFANGVTSVVADERGVVVQVDRPWEVTAANARAALVRAAEFVALLDGTSTEIPALLPPSAADVVDVGASSSTSGAPVAVPVEVERRR